MNDRKQNTKLAKEFSNTITSTNQKSIYKAKDSSNTKELYQYFVQKYKKEDEITLNLRKQINNDIEETTLPYLTEKVKTLENWEKQNIRVDQSMYNEFKKELFTLLGDKKSTFENDGKIIYKKIAFAKDWNDYYNLMQKDPKFVANQKEICERYEHYLQQDNVVSKKFSLSK